MDGTKFRFSQCFTRVDCPFLVNSAEEGAEPTAKSQVFLCSFSRGQLPSQSFTPKTLAGPKGSSRPLKLWAGAPRSCCRWQRQRV